ncbi:MAG: tRNA (adenosine(37)-N6)-threonylcarbamoyltransferase complex dimerization subunit type 1 TsaB [Bacteroides sp.]|nr:tRNA (adenosine(37)-N6)-threonylcarbamoyltransferase complex dimerization subunit type 1 TsaB [Bacteroides sp.]
MLILGLDASAVAGSCALCDIGEEKSAVIAESFVNTKQTHSQTLLPMIEAMMKNAGIDLNRIERIAVTDGPGSFTGIRIGVAAVKGLAYALDIPCVGVSTLHALACNLVGFEGIVCAVMDARCNQFYNALFSVGKGAPERITPDRAISADELTRELAQYKGKRIILVGDGAELAFKLLKDVEAELAPLAVRFQKAENVCLASAEYDIVSAGELTPVYLRLPQAERERLARLNSK